MRVCWTAIHPVAEHCTHICYGKAASDDCLTSSQRRGQAGLHCKTGLIVKSTELAKLSRDEAWYAQHTNFSVTCRRTNFPPVPGPGPDSAREAKLTLGASHPRIRWYVDLSDDGCKSSHLVVSSCALFRDFLQRKFFVAPTPSSVTQNIHAVFLINSSLAG